MGIRNIGIHWNVDSSGQSPSGKGKRDTYDIFHSKLIQSDQSCLHRAFSLYVW